MSQQHALDRLRARNAVFGVVQTLPLPTISDLALLSGFDFVIVDCEHGIADEGAHLACFQAMARSNAFCGVRLRPRDFGAVGRYLDFGAEAILMADVRDVADATELIAAATPAPKGKRGSTGGARVSNYGLGNAAARPPLLLALIESAQAVRNIEAIAATAGLDGVVVGPSDLSADLDIKGDYSSPDFRNAVERIERATLAKGLILGARPYPGATTGRLLNTGYTFVIAGSDVGALRDGFAANLATQRTLPDVGR